MAWWGWITVGALLLIAELTIVDLEFYLVFLAFSALTVGLLVIAGLPLPIWLQWIAFAAIALLSLVVFRKRVYARLRPPGGDPIRDDVDGERAVAQEAIVPGASGAVLLRGARWTGRNQGPVAIPAGATCLVERRQGLVLDVRLEKQGV